MKGQVKEAFGYQLTFRGEENPSRKDVNTLLVEVKKGKDNFTAKPRLYWSEYSQAMMRKPHIKKLLDRRPLFCSNGI